MKCDVMIEIKALTTEGVEAIKAHLARIPTDDKIAFWFDVASGGSPTACFDLMEVISGRPNTLGIASSVWGADLMPFLACKERLITEDCEVVIATSSYPRTKAVESLINWIEGMSTPGHYFLPNMYEMMSATLAQTAARVRGFDERMKIVIRRHTTIPEDRLADMPLGIELSTSELLEWGFAAAVHTN